MASDLITECTDDGNYFVSLPYTIENSTLLSATAGSCSETSTEITTAQDASRFNVTINIERCGLNTVTYGRPKVTAKNLFMANVTNLKVGRKGASKEF